MAGSIEQARGYFISIGETLRDIGDPAERAELLGFERRQPEYRGAARWLDDIRLDRAKEKARERKERPRPHRRVEGDQKNPALSKSQADIIWAREQPQEFQAIFETGPDRTRGYITQLTKRLLDDPELFETAFSTWQLEAQDDSVASVESEPAEDLCKRVGREVRNTARNWKEIKVEHLANLFTVYAHNPHLEEVTGTALKAYFEKPKELRDRVDAYYKFAQAAVELVGDDESVRQIVLFGHFQNALVPFAGDFHNDICFATIFSLFDNELLLKVSAAKWIFSKLAHISNVELVSFDLRALNQEKTEARVKSIFLKDFRRHPQQEVLARFDAMTKFIDSDNTDDPRVFPIDYKDVAEEGSYRRLYEAQNATWPESIVNVAAKEDPVVQALSRRIGGRPHVENFKKIISSNFGLKNGFTRIMVPVNGSGRYVVEVVVPQEMIDAGEKEEAIAAVIGNLDMEALSKAFEIIDDEGLYAFGIWAGTVYVGELPVPYMMRNLAEDEEHPHSLQLLKAYGFPLQKEEDGSSVFEMNGELAKYIMERRKWFLSERPTRVPLTHPDFTNMGYEYIDFYKDSDTGRTKVRIHVNGTDVEYLFDKRLNIDYEGGSVDLGTIEDSLRYVTLYYLKQLLCRDMIVDREGTKTDIKRQFIARRGHLRWLRPGHRYHDDQALALFADEDLDLAIVNARRKEQYGTDLNTTYVKPRNREDEDGDLPPITIYLPPPDRVLPDHELEELEHLLLSPLEMEYAGSDL